MVRYYSFSLIDTFKQCPRKFYFTYIKKLPRKPNIHFARGNVMHSTMERFFEAVNPSMSHEDMKFMIKNLFVALWNQKKPEMESLKIDDLNFYFEESKMMIDTWIEFFLKELEDEKSKGFDQIDAFTRLKPKMEVKYMDHNLKLIGYIDAITEKDGKIELLDYKTSKTADIEKYRLQLGIYALLYKMKHGRIPDRASLFFFKHGKKSIKVDEDLIRIAQDELAKVKEDTKSEEKTDYPKCVTPLCRWATGECDFFDECFDDDNAYQIARADSGNQS